MAYGLKFIINAKNAVGETYEVRFEYKDYIGGYSMLTAAADFFEDRNTTGDEDKLSYILGREAIIKMNIHDEDGVDIDDFVAAEDDTIRVTIYINRQYDYPVYQGFIAVEDNYQPFLSKPFSIQVRALDGLGLMKETYMLDQEGNPFAGKMSILSWICQILYNTDQTLNIRTYFNVYHKTFNTVQNSLEQIYIDAITFATGSQTPVGDIDPADFSTGFVDFYTALEYIMRNMRCKIFQDNGCWHVVNLEEYFKQGVMSYYEYQMGTPTGGIVPFTQVGSGIDVDYSVPIGYNNIIKQVKNDADVYLKLATKSVEYVYNYDQSLNKICNQDLSQGTFNHAYDEVISSSIIDPTINNGHAINLQTFGIDAYCWPHYRGPIGGTGTPVKNGFIRKVVDGLGYEYERFLVLVEDSTTVFFRSSELLVDAGDKFELSLSFRTRNSTGAQNNQPVAYVLFYGDDGTYWTLRSYDSDETNNPTTWVQSNSSFTTNVRFVGHNFQSNTNSWESVTTGTNTLLPSVPGSGKIVIILPSNVVGGGEYWYKDLTVTIYPYLNGSYREIKGDFNYSASTLNIKQTIQEEVQISDSPKRYFKGALFNSSNGLVLLTPEWYLLSQGTSKLYRFTQLMQQIVYSHLYRQFRKIEGTFKGLVWVEPNLYQVRIAGVLNSYYFTDSRWPTKRFMLSSYDKQVGSATFRGVFIEVLKDQNDIGLVTPDNYIFAYLFQST